MILYSLQGLLIIAVLGYLFYQNLFGIFALTPILYFYLKSKKKKLLEEKKWKLNLEFRDGIQALSAALEAGYSAEHALEEACIDLRQIYREDDMILQEFAYMINQLRMNITLERAFEEFGERSGLEDIQSFAQVFSTAKRTGGDLIRVIKTTGSIISDKIEVKRDIITLITGKRLEANMMKAIPLLIIGYLTIFSPGFLDPLYHNVFGVLIMTIFLIAYLGAFLIIDKIVAIRI